MQPDAAVFVLPYMTGYLGSKTMFGLFNESEWEWIARRADKISLETGEPLPIARSTAMAQLVCLRSMPKAQIVPFDSKRRAAGAERGGR